MVKKKKPGIRKELPPLMSRGRGDWRTPPFIINRITRTFGEVLLDPCPAVEEDVGFARVNLRQPQYDGLKENWAEWVKSFAPETGVVYVNPPYGRGIGAWTSKCYEEARRGAEIIALLPARTDTRWFPWQASAMIFWRGRITFVPAESPATFPSVFAYWGYRGDYFRLAFEGAGQIVRPVR